MGVKLELPFDAADVILVAILKDSVKEHMKYLKKNKLQPEDDEAKYLDAAKVVLDWWDLR